MIAYWGRRILAVGLLTASLATVMAFALVSSAWADETFGVESFASSIVSKAGGAGGGVPDLQAGSHPYALTTAIEFNHVVTAIEKPLRVRTYGDPKDIEVNLPAGMIVDPLATETRCTETELESAGGPASCPNAAAVGVVSIYLDDREVLDEPVYNMAPPAGVPAELGFNAAGIGLIMHVGGRLRTGTDYGLSADISNISDEHPIYGLELTLWGDPSDASHDEERGLCTDEKAKQSFKNTGIHSSCPVERTTKPFLTLPSSCTGEPLLTTMNTDSWQEPGTLNPDGTPDLSDPRWQTATSSSPPVTGCESLTFNPKLTVGTAEPEAASAESPSGLSFDLKLPSEESVNGVAGADLKEVAMTLPAGMAISPSAAGGREACTPEEIELDNAKEPSCPDASKVGTAKIVTPLLEGPLEGSIYLAQQGNAGLGQGVNPFGSLLAFYLVVENDGLLIKLAGKVEADPSTGQLTVTFGDIPQLPFSEMKLELFGGPRAVLVTPAACGVYEAKTSLTPWNGTPTVVESSNLEIDSGPNGGACPSGHFNPTFMAGTANDQAGAFSSFSVTLSRQDGEQRFGAVTLRMPAGLLGVLKNVALCPEPQAALGTCSQASAIGAATIGVGPGPDPFYLPMLGRQASVYLTGPYKNAPFGLSVVVPATAGPFDLGTTIMRAKVEVDPRTAQLIVTSDPLPSILEGIPLDIRTIAVTVDRADFMFNPTNCAPQTVAATIASAGGANAAVSSPFLPANCAYLPFAPKLSVLTHAQTSRKDGAYLHVKVVSGPGQANIGKVKVDLPAQLPSRLTTLQKACVAAVFEADPAACPAASIVGTTTVITPMLAKPLAGPAYLVSHGAAAFPALVMVLQGEGLELDLEGQTSISKGITSSTFRSLPDAPISTLDLVLPMGPHSIFAANLPPKAKRGLCAQTLKMPTAITGQNGAQVKQTTRIGITGCPPARPKHKQAKAKQKTEKKVKRMLGWASPALAMAHHPSGDYAPFADCPLSNPATDLCILGQTASGKLSIGKKLIPIAKTITLQGGVHEDRATEQQEFIGAEDGATFSRVPLLIPGGPFEIAAPKSLPGFVQEIFNEFVDGKATGLTATTEFAAPASAVAIDTQDLAEAKGRGLSLPVKIKLSNPLLGESCYIGSNADPIAIPLTTGTTGPSALHKSIKGKPGHAHFKDEYNLVTIAGDSLVNDSFPAPRASGCGGLLSFLVDPAINADLGLPVAAGGNEAILNGTLRDANAPAVKASE
jgi:hypothetical protein